MKIANDVRYIGVNDHTVDLFEGLYKVPDGMSYNSYVVLDEKVAVLDTVDGNYSAEWLVNLATELNGRLPDYLVVHHMEPDHSAAIGDFLKLYPQTTVVGNARTFAMMSNYFPDAEFDKLVVKDNDELSLGAHTLRFILAPMVHWPEVMMSFDTAGGTLFSADAFGKFGALDVSDDDWACEARRYYFGIVGKYGAQVQSLFKKLFALKISAICPLHGPALTKNLDYYFNLYNIWSSYGVESDGVFIAYTSVYGHTKKAAEFLAEELKRCGCPKVVLTDLARSDISEAVEDAFRYGKIALATTTYNLQLFPFMREFIADLTERNFRKRKIAVIENGSWAPTAGKLICDALSDKNEIVGKVTVVSSMSEKNKTEIAELAKKLL